MNNKDSMGWNKLVNAIKKDGFIYAVVHYSQFSEITDDRFHLLRKRAKTAFQEINDSSSSRHKYTSIWRQLHNYILECRPDVNGFISIPPHRYFLCDDWDSIPKEMVYGNAHILEDVVIKLLTEKHGYKGDNLMNDMNISSYDFYLKYMKGEIND